MSDRKVAERRWTDVEHIALAEKQLEDAYRYFDKPDPLTAAILAAAHGAVALLASRPTETEREHFDGPDRMELVRELREAVGLSTAASSMSPRQAWIEALDRARQANPGPDNELVRRAMQGVTGDLLDENKRLWAENERLRARLAELIDAMGGGNTPAIRDQIERAVAVIHGEPVPSTGEDQRVAEQRVPDLMQALEDSVAAAKKARDDKLQRPVPDEGSETGMCDIFGIHCDCGGSHDEGGKTDG